MNAKVDWMSVNLLSNSRAVTPYALVSLVVDYSSRLMRPALDMAGGTGFAEARLAYRFVNSTLCSAGVQRSDTAAGRVLEWRDCTWLGCALQYSCLAELASSRGGSRLLSRSEDRQMRG